MRALGCAQLQQAWSSFASGLEGSWSSYRRAAAVSQGLRQHEPRDVVEIGACGWPLQRPSTQSKDDGMRKRLAQEAAFYDDDAERLRPEHVAVIRKLLC